MTTGLNSVARQMDHMSGMVVSDLRSVLLIRSDTCCRYSLAYSTTGSVSFKSRGEREDDRYSNQSTAGASS